jgi:hypothetical protein
MHIVPLPLWPLLSLLLLLRLLLLELLPLLQDLHTRHLLPPPVPFAVLSVRRRAPVGLSI